jgi:hypothetical protein
LLLCLLFGFVRIDSAPNLAVLDRPFRTEKDVYAVKFDGESVKLNIKTSYTNRTGGTVYLSRCKEPVEPILQKKTWRGWVVAYERPQVLCGKKPVEIKPGETFKDRFEMEAFLRGYSGLPRFEAREVPGTYRLLQRFHRGRELGPLVPFSGRVSNEFELVEK